MKKLSEIGERTIINHILKELSPGLEILGGGDDCAVFEFGKDYLLVTTDMVTQHTHFPKEMTAWQIGWFTVAINLSDIAAKGGMPLGVVLALGVPKETSEQVVLDIMKGADSCATQYGCSIVGGDTKESKEITLCGTALGLVGKQEFMPRKGAQPGDVVAVTGTLGKAGAGYYAVQNKIPGAHLRKGLFQPIPRLNEGQLVAKQQIVTSSMDLSDGLSSSLYQLREINKVGFLINKDQLPLASELLMLKKKYAVDEYGFGLHFGGDYELLLTLPKDTIDKANNALKKTSTPLTVIGEVTEEKDIVLVEKNKKKILSNKGYEHFFSRKW